MRLLMITYNLNKKDDDYGKLFALIKQLGPTWHDGKKLDSVWFVKSDKDENGASEHIKAVMDSNDYWFVSQVSKATSQGWMPKDFWEWLGSS